MPLVADNLTYTYPQAPAEPRANRPALSGVSMVVREGSVLAIAGANGSGKSTLLALLAGLLEPDSGELRVEAPEGTAASVTLALQRSESQFFATTVEGELAYGPRARGLHGLALAARVDWAASTLEIERGFLQRSPFALSGGEARRVALASVVATAPRFLLLDEPGAGLDAAGAAALRSSIRRLQESGCGIVLVSHDAEEMAAVAGEVMVLRAGRVLRHGSADEVLTDVETLTAAGVPAPLGGRLIWRLRQRGLMVPPGGLRPVDVAQRVARALAVASVGTPGATAPASARGQTGATPLANGSIANSDFESGPVTAHGAATAGPGPGPWLAHRDPRASMAAVAGLALAALATNGPLSVSLTAFVTLAAPAAGGLGWRQVRDALRPAVPLILFAAVMAALATTGGQALLPWPPVTDAALWAGMVMALRLGAVVAMAGTFSYCVTPLAIADAVDWCLRPLRHAGLAGSDWGLAVANAHRFLPVLVADMERIRLAQALRRGERLRKVRSLRVGAIVPLMVALVVGAVRRADTLTMAILARGYGRTPVRTPIRTLRWSGSDWLLLGVACITALLAVAGW